jgi:hypothetical protein
MPHNNILNRYIRANEILRDERNASDHKGEIGYDDGCSFEEIVEVGELKTATKAATAVVGVGGLCKGLRDTVLEGGYYAGVMWWCWWCMGGWERQDGNHIHWC